MISFANNDVLGFIFGTFVLDVCKIFLGRIGRDFAQSLQSIAICLLKQDV